MKQKLHKILKVNDLKDMLDKSGKIYGDKPAYKLKTKTPGEYKIITHKEARENINNLGTALIEMGLKGKRIAVISENRYEWGLSYLAVATGTGIVVPLDKSLPENEIESLIARSNAEAIIFSDKYLEALKRIKAKGVGKLNKLISMDQEENKDGVYSLKKLQEKGKELIKNGDRRFLDAKIDAESMGIMLFTSGTTAMSKAVMLSHKNIVSNIMDIASILDVNYNDIMLSFLPLHHVFECTTGFLYPLYRGACVAYCDGLRHIQENLQEYHISVMVSVPILFETMYRRLMKAIEKQGKLGTVNKGIAISNALLKVHIDARKKIFKEIHEKLGGQVRLFISGAAALDPEIEKGYNELGIRIAQGYGLTETSPVIAAGSDFDYRLGSIGKKLPSVEVRIEDMDENGVGELVAKGPNIMLGYYENEEETKKVLKDGWFYTGDLAKIDKDGFIFIYGRKKSVIVLKNGKNVFPEELENLVNRIEGVKESFVYGKPEDGDERDPKVCVKIVYDPSIMEEMYNIKNRDEIQNFLTTKIKEINKTIPTYKYIKEVSITTEELIKTTTAKIKRHEEMKKVLAEKK